jgi:hypothetical protein
VESPRQHGASFGSQADTARPDPGRTFARPGGLRLIDDNFETDTYFSELFIDDEINVSSTNATYGESYTAMFCYRCDS